MKCSGNWSKTKSPTSIGVDSSSEQVYDRFMKYDKFTYLYPPRAENAIPPSKLGEYQRKGWIAQVKKNGTNSVIFVPPDRKVFAMGRENNQHKQWDFSPGSAEIFRSIPGNGWYVINAELLHSKVSGLRDINYIHDILVDNGEYLIGTTYAQRYSRLLMMFLNGNLPKEQSHYVLNQHTWLARNHGSDFTGLFESLERPEDEGIVLKNMQGKLAIKNNNGWTVKCRRLHKNFSY